ncbi:hypothetical protein BAY61_14935 [Prauserella marina]|uniref:Uncharacterized protein n=1 Tax=Prauserella marina TaxID=530584 RepID=A0A222VQC3_9PSEU|nr:hypothetical protein [Prauserella marina]ASR36084.1 hypothetical protein BAY61_14935 [Prauserella marina]PWV76813.1 hypothetical protein DES30_10529 [Prauserella marina]SDC98161.1 hypothetical protein SAMN05421630_10530 [Prauserella marina]
MSGERTSGAAEHEVRIGLIAEPDSPERTADWLVETLSEQGKNGYRFEAEISVVVAGKQRPADMLDAITELMREREWTFAICLSDLPVRERGRTVVADVRPATGVALVSLPALGTVRIGERARRVVLELLDDLADERAPSRGLSSVRTRRDDRVPADETSTGGTGDVRYLAEGKAGRLRLISGMVRANSPWKLIFGLSGALAAAGAASAFGLTSSTIWQLGHQLETYRQVLAALVAVGVLVFWLIAGHGLWENRRSALDREQAGLYNVSTVMSLVIGVAVMYTLLFVINVGVVLLMLPSGLLASTVGEPAGPTTYLSLAWAFTTMGAIAGALGASVASDSSVRRAAYGYREQRRRDRRERT